MHLRNSANLRRWSPFAEMDRLLSVLSPQTTPQVNAHFAEMRRWGDGSAPPTNHDAKPYRTRLARPPTGPPAAKAPQMTHTDSGHADQPVHRKALALGITSPHAAPANVSPKHRRSNRAMPDRFLSIRQVAERLGTTQRFPRRLIEERRIEFKRFGRHVRIAETVLDAYIASCTVQPVLGRNGGGRA